MSSYGREFGWLEAILADPATPLEAVEWTIVAADAGEAVGYASVTGLPPGELFIGPGCPGRGIGGALLAASGPAARRFDTATLRACTPTAMPVGSTSGNGYRVRETQTIELPARQVPAWFMEKQLA